jgi:hypothetical protein
VVITTARTGIPVETQNFASLRKIARTATGARKRRPECSQGKTNGVSSLITFAGFRNLHLKIMRMFHKQGKIHAEIFTLYDIE